MSLARLFDWARRGAVTLALCQVPAAGIAAQDAPGSGAIADYLSACQSDGGAFWGRSLCGPMLTVDPGSRQASASELPPGGDFRKVGTVYVGVVPPGIPLANTSLDWAGRSWAFVLQPLPEDRTYRLALLLHESYHRIQDSLGLGGGDPLNAHLDERDGRFWLRMELRAMAAALRDSGAAALAATRDAMRYRAIRNHLYPGSDTLESALELHEGLAEYTGIALALTAMGQPPSRAADLLDSFQARPSFARALGYGTGPGLGLLLDRYSPGWRGRVAQHGFAAQLAAAVRVPLDSQPDEAAMRSLAAAYGASQVALEEDRREVARQQRLTEYRGRLVAGPVLVLEQKGLSRSFDPNTLIPLAGEGTIYPTGSFGAAWGSLEVREGGALVSPDNRMLRVPLPSEASGNKVTGKGWELELAPGWHLGPGARDGDLTVRADSVAH
jgi:hypothetical protein